MDVVDGGALVVVVNDTGLVLVVEDVVVDDVVAGFASSTRTTGGGPSSRDEYVVARPKSLAMASVSEVRRARPYAARVQDAIFRWTPGRQRW